MINLTDAKQLVVKNFKKDFGGMNMSEQTAIDFLNMVMTNAFNGRCITSKDALANAYRTSKLEFFGISA